MSLRERRTRWAGWLVLGVASVGVCGDTAVGQVFQTPGVSGGATGDGAGVVRSDPTVNPLLTSPVLQLQLDQMMLRDSASAGMTPAQREVLLNRQRMNRNLTLYSMVQNRSARLRQAEAIRTSARGKREIQGPVSTPTERVTRYYGRIVPSGTGRAATGYYEQPNRYFPQTGYSR